MKKKFLTLTLLAPLYISSAFAAEAVMDAEENKTLLGSDHVPGPARNSDPKETGECGIDIDETQTEKGANFNEKAPQKLETVEAGERLQRGAEEEDPCHRRMLKVISGYFYDTDEEDSDEEGYEAGHSTKNVVEAGPWYQDITDLLKQDHEEHWPSFLEFQPKSPFESVLSGVQKLIRNEDLDEERREQYIEAIQQGLASGINPEEIAQNLHFNFNWGVDLKVLETLTSLGLDVYLKEGCFKAYASKMSEVYYRFICDEEEEGQDLKKAQKILPELIRLGSPEDLQEQFEIASKRLLGKDRYYVDEVVMYAAKILGEHVPEAFALFCEEMINKKASSLLVAQVRHKELREILKETPVSLENILLIAGEENAPEELKKEIIQNIGALEEEFSDEIVTVIGNAPDTYELLHPFRCATNLAVKEAAYNRMLTLFQQIHEEMWFIDSFLEAVATSSFSLENTAEALYPKFAEEGRASPLCTLWDVLIKNNQQALFISQMQGYLQVNDEMLLPISGSDVSDTFNVSLYTSIVSKSSSKRAQHFLRVAVESALKAYISGDVIVHAGLAIIKDLSAQPKERCDALSNMISSGSLEIPEVRAALQEFCDQGGEDALDVVAYVKNALQATDKTLANTSYYAALSSIQDLSKAVPFKLPHELWKAMTNVYSDFWEREKDIVCFDGHDYGGFKLSPQGDRVYAFGGSSTSFSTGEKSTRVYAFDAENGRALWHFDWGDSAPEGSVEHEYESGSTRIFGLPTRGSGSFKEERFLGHKGDTLWGAICNQVMAFDPETGTVKKHVILSDEYSILRFMPHENNALSLLLGDPDRMVKACSHAKMLVQFSVESEEVVINQFHQQKRGGKRYTHNDKWLMQYYVPDDTITLYDLRSASEPFSTVQTFFCEEEFFFEAKFKLVGDFLYYTQQHEDQRFSLAKLEIPTQTKVWELPTKVNLSIFNTTSDGEKLVCADRNQFYVIDAVRGCFTGVEIPQGGTLGINQLLPHPTLEDTFNGMCSHTGQLYRLNIKTGEKTSLGKVEVGRSSNLVAFTPSGKPIFYGYSY